MPVFPQMGGVELLVILAIILLFFGARRVPELARSLGKGKREFHKGIQEAEAGAQAEEEPEKTEAHQDKEESPPPEGTHPEERSIRDGEKPKTGASSKA
jgi:sec-independent protein translocase protein TatA